MLDRFLGPASERLLGGWATLVLQSGLTPNRLTLIGFFFGLAAAISAGLQAYALALILVLLNRLFAGLSGVMARMSLKTAFGSYLALVCDIAIVASFIFFFSLGMMSSGLAAAFAIFAYGLMIATWLARVCFERRSDPLSLIRGGLVGNSETIFFLALCCVMPQWFPALAALFGLLCLAAAVLHFAAGMKTLRSQ